MQSVLLFLNLGMSEILVIALIILLLFGGSKIPELMKGLGKGVKSFKQGVAEAEAEIKKTNDDLNKSDQTDKKA